ncbi:MULTISPECIES: ABC transporter permease [unclassified Kitasatospora]|uniref:ABC transporter permease n=1 Tax=unclassified Kitasatospora TaxID=2633591 RepID=UPI00070B9B5B|nr:MULTISPECIES: ABC transporter permease [unclassified Kitasatospora]KQV05797.1 ABC transporter permease [Kitasatospora sp. Root107]KRB62600.1 ABC transporter permease [Kitasatospora sp. Root187]
MAAQQLLPVGPSLWAVTALLLAAGAVTAGWGLLGHGWAVLRAGARAGVQLAAVALVIAWVAGSMWTSAPFVLVMFTVAVRTAGRRMTAGPGWWWAAVPIGVGVLPVLTLLVGSRLLPWQGLSVIPVAGILIGGALTATSLAGRRALDELRQRRGEVEAALALGFESRDARLEICRTAAATSLVPALDQTRTVGLVTLPGAFVGMLLGGASPLEAGAVQLFVLVALLLVEAVAILLVLELVGRGAVAG